MSLQVWVVVQLRKHRGVHMCVRLPIRDCSLKLPPNRDSFSLSSAQHSTAQISSTSLHVEWIPSIAPWSFSNLVLSHTSLTPSLDPAVVVDVNCNFVPTRLLRRFDS